MKTIKFTLCFFLLMFATIGFSQNDNESYTRAWGTLFGENTMGDSYMEIHDSVLDEEGNLWLTGRISSYSAGQYFDYLITPDAHQPTFGGGYRDFFIVKLSPEGDLLYATYFGGEDDEGDMSIDVKNGKMVLSGTTKSKTNITTEGAYQEEMYENIIQNGQSSYFVGFIAQFDTSGQLEWATYYQGNQRTTIIEVKKSLGGDLFVWGNTQSTDMGTPGAFKDSIPPLSQTTGGQPPYYPILAKFSDEGNLVWATYYGPDYTSGQTNSSAGLAVDHQGFAYVGGVTYDTSGYFATEGTHQSNLAGPRDIFLAKFDEDGQRIWGTYFGGPADETVVKIFVPYKDNIYITGTTYSQSGIATPGTFQDTFSGGGKHGFLAKFDFMVGSLIWATYLPPNNAAGVNIGEDQENNVYAYFSTAQEGGFTTPGSFQEQKIGDLDVAVMKLDANGEELLWGSYYGGSGNEFQSWSSSNLFKVDGEQRMMYFMGVTTSGNSSHLLSQYPYQSQGNLFIAKFIPCPEVQAPQAVSPQEYVPGMRLEDLEVEFIEWSGSPLIIRWYADAGGGQELSPSFLVTLNQTYYVSQQIQGCPESELVPVLISELSVAEYDETHLKIYPNPSDGKFVIEGLKDNSVLTLYDLQGRQIYNTTARETTHTIDLSKFLSTGIYLLEVSHNQNKTTKFISVK